MDQNKNPNQLAIYRRRMRYSQKQVALLLELGDTVKLSRYEKGHLLPPLTLALQLAAAYRVPVDFLFQQLYVKLRAEIRSNEAVMRGRSQQGALF